MSFDVTQITDELFVVYGDNRGRFPSSNSILIQDETCALIDSGCGCETLHHIRDNFEVDLLINSHGHPDHCAGNWIFNDVPLFAPIEGRQSHGRLLPLSQRFFGPGPLADYWRPWVRSFMGFQDREPTHYYGDGYVFDFGRTTLTAIHTPGHTADHYCFFEPDNKILLSFDIDLTNFGPWYGNVESSLMDFRRSLGMLRALNPRVVAPGHQEIVNGAPCDAFDQYEGFFDARGDAILKLVHGGANRDEMIQAAPIYGTHPYEPELLRFFEGRMIDLHLEELTALGKIEIEGSLQSVGVVTGNVSDGR